MVLSTEWRDTHLTSKLYQIMQGNQASELEALLADHPAAVRVPCHGDGGGGGRWWWWWWRRWWWWW